MEKFSGSDTPSSGDDGQPSSQSEDQYFMKGSKLAFVIAGLCVALFLLGLDTAIVSTV
jgi:hypothetical protein